MGFSVKEIYFLKKKEIHKSSTRRGQREHRVVDTCIQNPLGKTRRSTRINIFRNGKLKKAKIVGKSSSVMSYTVSRSVTNTRTTGGDTK